MKFTNSSNTRSRTVVVEHGDDAVYFDVNMCHYYIKKAPKGVETLFEKLNEYLSSLDEQHQRQIFEQYRKIRSEIDEVLDHRMLHKRLTTSIAELIELLDYDRFITYMRRYVTIRVPDTIKDDYEELDISERSSDYKKLTYLRDDYLDLVRFSIFIRSIMPIWSEYIRLFNQRSVFREYQAFNLLSKSSILKTRAYLGLKEYIDSTVEKKIDELRKPSSRNSLLSSVLSGMSESELPQWIISTTIIRRLVAIDLEPEDGRESVISKVYNYIDNQFSGMDRKFSGFINEKVKPGDNDDDDEKSLIETYKIKQDLSDGDLMVLSIYTEDPYAMAMRLKPDIDHWRLDRCLENIDKIHDINFSISQLSILRWVVSEILPPKSIENIRKRSLFSVVATAQAILWERGHYDLAKLLTSERTLNSFGGYHGGTDANRRIPKNYINELNEYYPINHKPDQERAKQANPAIRAIETITTDLTRSSWRVQAPSELLNLGTPVDHENVFDLPPDIRIRLADLILELAKIAQQRVQSTNTQGAFEL